MLYHAYNIVIYCGVGAPGHVKDVVGGFNANIFRFLTILMTTVQLPVATNKNLQMFIHTAMSNMDINLERVF